MPSAGEIALLSSILDHAFEGQAWHGTTLAGSIRGVTTATALWRPARGRHNVWELVLHTAYWKYAVRRRLTGESRGSFARPGSNWPPLPADTSAQAWRKDVRLLKEEHRRLRDSVGALRPGDLAAKRGKWTVAQLVHGVAAHDLYHAGQIQLLKRLHRS